MKKHPITVAQGNGIGPEIMQATLYILKEAGALLEIEEVEIGEKIYLKGYKSGIEEKTWESLRRTKTFLKGPVTTPQGGGFKSLNVTIRTSFGLYANVRPCIAYAPFIKTKHPNMDLVIVRENEEDLYTGIEYQQTPEVCEALKLISRPGCERIIRYAFEYATLYGRKKVTCFTKDNIMKMTDGLFHKRFDEMGLEYPDLLKEHWIVDIGAAKLADTPELFDVIVMPNLYGDILSDVAAQISGSVGLAGSANIGQEGAMFEAIHGSALALAGKNRANPSGLLLAAIYMLLHLKQLEPAARIHNAWLKTIEEGIHTADIYDPTVSTECVGTREFAKAIVARLGQKPAKLKEIIYSAEEKKVSLNAKHSPSIAIERKLVGVDVYVFAACTTQEIIAKLQKIKHSLKLLSISNRGVKVWPEGHPETFCVDRWRGRFLSQNDDIVTHETILKLLQECVRHGLDFIKMELLFTFDGKPGFSD